WRIRERDRASIRLLGLRGRVRAYPGSNVGLTGAETPQRCAGARAVVTEGRRPAHDRLWYARFGAGLAELASAYLIEPRIAERLTAARSVVRSIPTSAFRPRHRPDASRLQQRC